MPVTMLNIPPLYEMFFDFLRPKINAEGNYELGELASADYS